MRTPKVGQIYKGNSGLFEVTSVTDDEVEIEIHDTGMTYAEDIENWPSNDYELVKDVE